MSKKVSYYQLGASLYTPCTHDDLSLLMQQGLSGVRSMIFCLEDAIKEDELSEALKNLKQALHLLNMDKTSSFKRFIRPKNPLILAEILNYPCIEKIDGFVLPKIDLNTFDLYANVLNKQAFYPFSLMPTLETEQIFDLNTLPKIRQKLDSWKQHISCLRIGGNDLMNLLGIKRMPKTTIYNTPLRGTIDQLIIQFRVHGFELSAPVFDLIDDFDTLQEELNQDLAYGFFAKTAIHPIQIAIIESTFSKFTQNHLEQAKKVLHEDSAAVFQWNGQMMERACHHSWAKRTVRFAKGS